MAGMIRGENLMADEQTVLHWSGETWFLELSKVYTFDARHSVYPLPQGHSYKVAVSVGGGGGESEVGDLLCVLNSMMNPLTDLRDHNDTSKNYLETTERIAISIYNLIKKRVKELKRVVVIQMDKSNNFKELSRAQYHGQTD
jgi:6-pyruvoyl-tetrahydropterin synthase